VVTKYAPDFRKSIYEKAGGGSTYHKVLTKWLNACFSKGSKILAQGEWGTGWREIEKLVVGDKVASRDEFDVNGEVVWKEVEETFTRVGRIWVLRENGREIRTTGEHPFFEMIQKWIDAGLLHYGDKFATLDGQWVTIEESYDTGEYETVYNLRVADFHTYFVGDEDWGFAGWAHNRCNEHHLIPKVVGGNKKQFMYSVDRATEHMPFHNDFAANLKATGFPLNPLGGRGNSTDAFRAHFLANQGSQRQVVDVLIRTAREFDAANGTQYLNFVKHNIRRFNFDMINW